MQHCRRNPLPPTCHGGLMHRSSWLLRGLVHLLVAFRAFIVRGVFIIYALLAVWSIVNVQKNRLCWLLLFTILPLVGELGFEVVLLLKGKVPTEPKWISPVILLFLLCACPPIWFGELHLFHVSQWNNSTTAHLMKPAAASTTAAAEWVDLNNHSEVNVFMKASSTLQRISPFDHMRILEQMLLLALICGRWLLPRGRITRDQLSQLLLVNIGMAADILELFEAFKEEVVRRNISLTLALLSLWQASLLQFSLTKTATKSRKYSDTLNAEGPGVDAAVHPNQHHSAKSTHVSNMKLMSRCLFCETELWAICTSLALQDVPFLVMRMTLIFTFNVLSYSNVFFTCKNTLVISLQLFRMGVIVWENRTPSGSGNIISTLPVIAVPDVSVMRGNHVNAAAAQALFGRVKLSRSTPDLRLYSISAATNITAAKTSGQLLLQPGGGGVVNNSSRYHKRAVALAMKFQQARYSDYGISQADKFPTANTTNASHASTRRPSGMMEWEKFHSAKCLLQHQEGTSRPKIILRPAYYHQMEGDRCRSQSDLGQSSEAATNKLDQKHI